MYSQLVLSFICIFPYLASSAHLNVTQIQGIQRLTTCRLSCLQQFDMDREEDCSRASMCSMCWTFCLMFEAYMPPERTVCNDELYCMRGCRMACDVYDSFKPDPLWGTSEKGGLELKQRDASVAWTEATSQSLVLYSVFIQHNSSWRLFDQTTSCAMSLSSIRYSTDVMVLAADKASMVATNVVMFNPPPTVLVRVPATNIPKKIVYGRFAGPVRPRYTPRPNSLSLMGVAEMSKILFSEDENIVRRKTRSDFSHNFNLNVVSNEQVQPGLRKVVVGWNEYPDTGVYTVRVIAGFDVTLHKANATLYLTSENLYTVQVTFKSTTREFKAESEEILIDTRSYMESHQKQSNKLSTTVIILLVTIPIIGVLLIASLCLCLKRLKQESEA